MASCQRRAQNACVSGLGLDGSGLGVGFRNMDERVVCDYIWRPEYKVQGSRV